MTPSITTTRLNITPQQMENEMTNYLDCPECTYRALDSYDQDEHWKLDHEQPAIQAGEPYVSTLYRIFYLGGAWAEIAAKSPTEALELTANDSGDQHVVAVVDAYLVTEAGRGEATSNLLGYIVGGQ
ncbi:hypothetical protein BJD55_gp030 [Gordonia phage Yvonnetastic]|uniref:Uncharacterized protein n=1 Tax=Gordonia phage Yvonnetastic TaxID=1821566 RepID=A0A142K9F3_9CAUD|nr:hypothetical protein BJD55_gp030 [Gordonia phage Yvonnetastic]AMS02736.1 hypothetical protein SEA_YVONNETASTIC_192 [Gordonia phage Yvonnetastic]